ncbi:hypothetical protein GCM10018771_66290 [Streptomyces cellulosae]|nr:hypothetical protein GCM10018771_66290 [Streptomyces cellulosae]
MWPIVTTGPDRPRAEVCETHTAVLFFAGDRVHKLKKPVDLGFLDYTTVPARRTACEREVELNRRFSPDVYLGLGELREPGARDPEPLVVMRRMPAERRLSRLVREGADVDDVLRAVARQLAAWHARAPRGPEVDAQGTRDALLSRWEDSFRQVRELAGDGGLPDEVPGVERLVRRYLAGRAPLFDTRIAQGRVVDGHGDLLAEDVFCLDDGPRLLDCLEFDDRLRHVDGLDDAAFLAMDLEQLGAPEAAAWFLARYGEFSGDPAPSSLRHHYVAYRAFVRAKVSGTTAHVLAGRSINRAQKWVFDRMTQPARPVLVTQEAEQRLEDPEVADDLGLDTEQAKALRTGELDMGLVNCRNPYASPHRNDAKVCHVAPAMCMLCRNAVVFTSQIPRLVLLSDHIEQMRARLTPRHWHALWGRQAAALAEVFSECADLIPAARREIAELGLRLDLPLGMRTEFDR